MWPHMKSLILTIKVKHQLSTSYDDDGRLIGGIIDDADDDDNHSDDDEEQLHGNCSIDFDVLQKLRSLMVASMPQSKDRLIHTSIRRLECRAIDDHGRSTQFYASYLDHEPGMMM
jgi:hypothetical protein